MNHIKYSVFCTQVYAFFLFGSIFCLFGGSKTFAQQQIALPSDGSYSAEHSPQGGLRYHRQLYLITADEMTASGISSNTDLNSIGFSIAAAQDTTTIAAFKVYLENTTDTDSRIDTNWTTVSAGSTMLTLENLAAGDYEWKVQALCSPSSIFSPVVEFSTADLSGCNQPMNLVESGITSTSATLSWYAPQSPNFTHYKVEYKSVLDANWVATTTTDTSLDISSLNSNINYQWRVRTFCSGDSSKVNGSSFATLNVNNCNSPSSLMVASTTDTSAQLNWTAAAGATRYDIRFRRLGTSFWLSALAFSNSYNLTFGLVAGTTYEWEVRTVCAAGIGDFVTDGNLITTSGTAVCYNPTSLFINNVSDTTVTLNWKESVGAASYRVQYRLKNSISWSNAIAPMAQVHNDTVLVPSVIGRFDIPFSEGSYLYTGGGLYVAFEYANDTVQLSTFNNSLATKKNSGIVDQNGGDSAQVVLCLNASNLSALPNLLTTTKTRPQTSFGSPSFVDSVGIEVVYALGFYALNFSDTTPVSVLVANYAMEQRDYCVQFEVKKEKSGTQLYTASKCISIAEDTTVLVSFDGWVPTIQDTVQLIMNVPSASGENILGNNQAFYRQIIGSSKVGYDDGSARVTHAGFADSSGLLLVKHEISGCGQINAAEVFLDYTAANHPLYAVVLDGAGSFLDSSEVFTPTDDETGIYHSFYFPNSPYIGAGEFYIGLAQLENPSDPYFPVGVQYETANIRENAYYRDSIGGMHLMEMPMPGRLMIRADVVSAANVPVIEGDLSLCSGDTNVLSLASATQRFANEVLGFSSEVSSQDFGSIQTLGSPNVYPTYAASAGAWVSATPDGQREYIQLGYSGGAPINYVDIYETFNPGAVDTVFVRNPGTGLYEIVYSGPASSQSKKARINRINFALTTFDVTEIRIALASDSVSGFHSIDAVAIGERTYPGVFSDYIWAPNSEITNAINVSTPGEYSVTVTDAGGCENKTSVIVSTPSSDIPVISIASGDTLVFCQGDSVTLISDRVTGNIWSTSDTTQTITVHTAGAYTVSYDDGTMCGLITSAPVNVVVNALPNPSIAGELNICPDAATLLDAGPGYSSYLWSTGETTQLISVSQADLYSVMVSNTNGCRGSDDVTTSISTPPSPSILGNLTFCPGSATTLDAGAGYDDYMWSTGEMTQTISVSTATTVDVIVTDGNGCTGTASVSTSIFTPPIPSISGELDFCLGEFTQLDAGSYSAYEWSTGAMTQIIDASVAGQYDVTVTDANGCTGSDTVDVVQNTPPTPVISGSFSFCGGSTTTLDAGAGYNSYKWSTGEISQQIVVGDTTTYSVTVTDMNGCKGSASATTAIEGSVPLPPGPITGPTEGLCNATNVVYSIDPVANAVFYVWMIADTNITILSGQGTRSILVNIGSGFTSADIIVAASNACGQSPSIDPTFITVTAGPSQSGTITGPSSGFCNEPFLSYSVSSVFGATSYVWSVPEGSVITSGQGTDSIELTLGATSGDICVRAVNVCDTGLVSCMAVSTTEFTVDAGGCKQVALGASPFDCVELTAEMTGGVGPYLFIWQDPMGTIIGTDQSVTVCPTSDARYQVEVTDVNGCFTSSVVDVYPVVVLCQTDRVNICHVSNHHTRCVKVNQVQGHLDHGDYFGSCYVANPCGNGDGFLQVGDEIFELVSLTDEKDQFNGSLQVYPNPAQADVALKFNAVLGERVLVNIMDPFQQVIKSIKFVGQDYMDVTVDLREFAPGIYFINVNTGSQLLSKSIIVQRN